MSVEPHDVAREEATMNCWHNEISRARTEAEVVTAAADYLSLWSPRELAPATLEWRALQIESGRDIEQIGAWFADGLAGPLSVAADARLYRELRDYLGHAADRLHEIRRIAS
jgi:hypothetical protein